MNVCFDAINCSIMPMARTLVENWLSGGRYQGKEFFALNPTREDKTIGSFSVNVDTGAWLDRATGDSGGDLISLYAYLNGLSQYEAAKELQERFGPEPKRVSPTKKNGKNDVVWTPIMPVPADAPEPDTNHFQLGSPVATYPYYDANNQLMGSVCRYDLPLQEGQDKPSKEFRPLTYCKSNDGRREWRWLRWSNPLPLYGLNKLAAAPDSAVLIVEGEKAAEAAQRFVGNIVVMSWPGGSEAVPHVDLSPLARRIVYLWPDNDKGGFKAMAYLADHASEYGYKVVGIALPDEQWSKGTDLADFPEWDTIVFNNESDARKVDLDTFKAEMGKRFGNGESVEESKETERLKMRAVLPPLPKFPIEIFPVKIRGAIEKAAEAFTVPLTVPATAFLSAIGACVGRTRLIVAKQGWVESANLYWGLVADSGMGKSPCSKAILAPLYRRETLAHEKYCQEMAAYEVALKERHKDNGATGNPKPDMPTKTEYYVEDSTSQAVGDVLQNNPRGVLWYRDEMSGFLSDLGRYDSKGDNGGDKARLMSAYDCAQWKVSRKTQPGCFIPHACISIFGTIQPGILPSLLKNVDSESGFLPRFTFIHCEKDGPALWSDVEFSEEAARPLYAFLDYCLDLDFDESGNPVAVAISKDAMELFKGWFNDLEMEQFNSPELARFAALTPKLKGRALRLCLGLHLLDCWNEELSDTDKVSLDTMERAVMLTDWVKAHQRQVWDLILQPELVTVASPLEKRVALAIVQLADKIVGNKLPTATLADYLNQDIEEKHQVSPVAVGHTYKKIGLEAGKISGGARCVTVTPESLERLTREYIQVNPSQMP